MVKNLPTVERSTKIRFGKHVPDSDVQAENTIVFNASNTLVTTPNSESIYMSPVRFRSDFSDTNIVLMMYNRQTGELSESGESASNLVGGQTLQATSERGNVTSNVLQFTGPDTSFVTAGKVGIANSLPGHTLSVGSNVYIDDTGSNVLVVSGGILLDGNLTVNGGVTSITTENLKIKDAIIELGQNNTSGDTTIDLGLIMTRPQSNVTVGFLESSKEIVLGFTESSADSNVITPLTSEDINVHVYGRLYTEANVGVINTNPMHTLDVGSNLYVDEFGSNILVVNGNAYASDILSVGDKLGVKTTDPDAELHVVGNVYVSSNLTVDEDTLHVDTVSKRVGIETRNPDANLHVVGNTYISDDLTIATDTFHAEASTQRVGIKTKSPDAELHVVGNVYVSSNLTVDTETLHVDAEASHVGVNTKYPKANLHVVGNTYVSSNLTVNEDTLHVDSTTNSVGIETKFPDANLHVVGNVYVSSDLTVDTDTFHVDASGNKVGIKTKSPDAELHVVGNVYVSSNLTVDTETLHVDAEASHVGVNTKTPKANLHVVGNVYVSSNLTVGTDTLHVDVGDKSIGLGTVNPTSNLHVVGNVYTSSNVTTDGTLTLNHPTTALITDLTSNVEVKLDQLNSVTIDALESDHILVYDGNDWINEFPLHTYIKIRNDAGVDIDPGDAVYVKGTHNSNILNVGLAQSDSATTMPCIGLSNQTLTAGQQGTAVAYGKALSVVTDTFLAGETVYVSNTLPGGLSNVKPFNNDLIQNVGVVTKVHQSNGGVFVTGIGRASDIPNAAIVADESDINYVYVNDQNNDLKKILPTNLLTQLQTLQQVTDTGNTTSNTIQFTNTTTGLVTTSNLQVGSNISVGGLTPNKFPIVGTGNFLEDSLITRSNGTIVISSDLQILGNVEVIGNSYTVESNSLIISDRIIGIANNNNEHDLDVGIIMEYPGKNIGLIHHGAAVGPDDPHDYSFTIGYTQNTVTANHVFDDANVIIVEILGNLVTQNNITVSENIYVTGTSALSGDLTVGAASNLFVDLSTSNVGINEGTPLRSLDVGGDARVQDTTDTTSTSGGALVVLGGLGVASNIHTTNVYAASHVGVGTVTATTPVHVMATSAGGLYVNGDGNDARVTLEATGTTADPVTSFSVNGGESFSVGIDNSLNDTFNIANHASDVGTNARLIMTPVGITTITNTTDATSTTDGALIVSGGLGVAESVYATTFRGTTLTGTNLYGTLAGANTVATTDLTASGTVKGATLTGTNLYGTLAGANTVATTDLTASGTVKGATITGTNLYGTLAGSNTVAASDITASGTVKGATITGTNLYGTLAGSNTVAASDITASGTVKGATLTGTNLYGTIAGSNAASVSTLTANDTTQATSRTTGAVTIAGGLGVSTNVHAANVYVTGGLITNTGGVTKKTYSYAGTFPAGTTDAQATLDIVFAAEVFSAKITAHLVEDDTEISVLSLDVGGGHKSGGTSPIIFKGPLTIFGGTNDNPWSSTVTTSTTTTDVTVSIKPTQAIQALITADYNIFVEYVSAASGGQLKQINDHQTSPVTVSFGY
jgi:hypothetical protein